ncbi:hypothetical protein PSY81_23980, partial [Shigella flexneri]|nr:hypothetical protein [Shigella flexneri]
IPPGIDTQAVRPVYSLGIDTWWYDVNKAAKLPSARQQGE